jgi:hypothetical protein
MPSVINLTESSDTTPQTLGEEFATLCELFAFAPYGNPQQHGKPHLLE